ncbi:hypothetical protein AVEN_141516-1 [Araneus ventricosus]|uniref:Uncharacterized protein n=1 Tax=Araneus ventricosus TaxID=182803 RepID=A0A4Y2T490_ARAVE|nr:hypothetical protein AVEN_229108-1 [Araneus ventricosus]GBN94249.1 hypothetical protein AVEN_141516-1 [Araneus ventricosus]
MSREFRKLPISRCLLPKSELIRDFKSELITQLFFGAPESETKFEPPKRFFTALLVLHSAFCFYPLPQGWSSAFLPLHWLIVLPGDQRLTFHVPSGQIQTWRRLLGVATIGAIHV